MKKQNYALSPNWKQLPTEGKDGLRALRTVLGVQWVLNMKAGHEEQCQQIQRLLNRVRIEMKRRELDTCEECNELPKSIDDEYFNHDCKTCKIRAFENETRRQK